MPTAVLLLVWLLLGTGVHARVTEGRIRAILLGDVIEQYGSYNSFTVIGYDPSIITTLIPSRPDYIGGYENAYRNMRQYMPRTYEQLVQSYDLIVSSDSDRLVFTSMWIGWLSKSVEDDGLGLLWLGSIMSEVFVGWEGTSVAEILPTSQAPGQYTRDAAFFMRIVDTNEPLMQSLPWEKTPALANVNAQVQKEASLLWATAEGIMEVHPLMTYWERGEGSVLCFSSKFPIGVLPWAKDWNLFPQAMIYMVYRTVGRELPDDPYLFERVINSFIEFSTFNSVLDSILEWVERFGGNPTKIRDRFDQLVDVQLRGERSFLEGDIEGAMDIITEARGGQRSLMEDAMKAKDEALFWVYVTEWCALLGTLMISSYVLWALMVRRRLYKEVRTSRLELKG
jgi:uncharacterized membrane protein